LVDAGEGCPCSGCLGLEGGDALAGRRALLLGLANAFLGELDEPVFRAEGSAGLLDLILDPAKVLAVPAFSFLHAYAQSGANEEQTDHEPCGFYPMLVDETQGAHGQRSTQ
jgi:hypothetical protein